MAETPSRRWAACAATPGHHALEGQRAGLRADDVEARRLGDQARVERGVALERGERAEAAVLLGGHRHEHDVGRRAAGAGHLGQRVQRRDHRALHVDAAAPVQPAVLQRARPRAVAPRRRPRRDDVDVAAERQSRPARRGRRPSTVRPHSSPRARLLAGMVGVRPQRREVVLVQVGAQAERRRRARPRRSSAARSSPVALGTCTSAAASPASARGVDHGVASSGVGSTSSAARVLDAPHGVGERAHVRDARRLDDVGGHRLAGAGGALAQEHAGQADALAGVGAQLDDDRDLAERVLAAGDRVDAELAQPRVEPGGGVDGAEDRVDRAVAGERALDLVAVGRAHADGGVRRAARGGLDVEPLQRVGGASPRAARR